jgi:hypothetical protein
MGHEHALFHYTIFVYIKKEEREIKKKRAIECKI